MGRKILPNVLAEIETCARQGLTSKAATAHLHAKGIVMAQGTVARHLAHFRATLPRHIKGLNLGITVELGSPTPSVVRFLIKAAAREGLTLQETADYLSCNGVVIDLSTVQRHLEFALPIDIHTGERRIGPKRAESSENSTAPGPKVD